MSLLQMEQYADQYRHMTGNADLAWASALNQALDEVARVRGVRVADIGVDDECEVAATLAAAVIALAAQTRSHGVTLSEMVFAARAELYVLDQQRPRRHPTAPS